MMKVSAVFFRESKVGGFTLLLVCLMFTVGMLMTGVVTVLAQLSKAAIFVGERAAKTEAGI